jgi:alpha-ketoglutarate-dependent taurine dioxygenase
LDRATSRTGRRTPPATTAFANGPTAIVRVETVARPDEPMKQLVAETTKDAALALQTVSEPLRELTDGNTSGALYGAVDKRTDPRVGVTPGCELQVYAPVMFTVTLKQGGIEKARVTANTRPGAQQV